MRRASAALDILSAYDEILHLSPHDIHRLGVDVPIPRADEATLLSLCQAASKVLSGQKALLWLNGPIVVVGDLHGNLHDLVRIWSMVANPFASKFLFLGDYVDRGHFQLEVMTLLLALAVEYPSKVFLLRGNHEVAAVNALYGFKAEVTTHYSLDVWSAFNEVFTHMPIAAVINKKTFCVHGGISPELHTLDDIESIPMPITDTTTPLISDMLWSDPVKSIPDFRHSKRGRGMNYGVLAVNNFLVENKLCRILRAHENVTAGVKPMFEGRLLTVFSSSGYTCVMDKGAFVTIDNEANTECHYYGSERVVGRANAVFAPVRKGRLLLVKSFMGPLPGMKQGLGGARKTMSLNGKMMMKFKTTPQTFEADSGEKLDKRMTTVLSAENLTLDRLIWS